MKIVLIGGSGFIGSALQKSFKDNQLELIKGREIINMNEDDLKRKIEDSEIVINLAGYPIVGRWTKKKKKKILDSRVLTTRKIVKCIMEADKTPHLINASAIGIYKSETLSNESSSDFDDNFLSHVVGRWEEEIKGKDKSEFLYSILRIGIVLGKEGGAYAPLRKLTKMNMGAVFAGGKQSLSFIYIEDLVRAIHFIIKNKIGGVINITAPDTTDYLHFMRVLKKKKKALLLWNAPGFIIKLLFGEASLMFLKGHKVYPGILLKNNFNFIAPNIETCIDKIERN